MKIKTVNVVEVLDDTISSLRSFTDDVEGNKEAEEVFTAILKEHGVNEDDLDSYIEDGYYSDDNGYEVNLTHSTL